MDVDARTIEILFISGGDLLKPEVRKLAKNLNYPIMPKKTAKVCVLSDN